MADPDRELTLTVDDFEMDAEGNLRIKTGARAELLLRLLVQARTSAQKQANPKGPRVKVEM
jgi:hypothetical protein